MKHVMLYHILGLLFICCITVIICTCYSCYVGCEGKLYMILLCAYMVELIHCQCANLSMSEDAGCMHEIMYSLKYYCCD